MSVDVSSVALIELCQEKGALYLDTCIEPWPGGYTDPTCRRRRARIMRCVRARWRCAGERAGGPTAVLTHGANPGLVSHFVKQALLDIARDAGLANAPPTTAPAGRRSPQRLGVKVIHIAERDTQVATIPKQPGEFVNTWSIDGFFSEGSQPAELGWGTHERHFPADGRRHDFGCGAAIYLLRPGASDPGAQLDAAGRPLSRLPDHPQRVDLDRRLFTAARRRAVRYRPTCHYAYHPCDDAVL